MDRSLQPRWSPWRTPAPRGAGIEVEDPTGAADRDDGARITVHRFSIMGNSDLPDAEIRAIVEPYEGRDMTFSEIRDIARRITRYYREQGHILSQAYIPQQRVRHGIVEIRIIEGRIDDVLIQGNRHYSTDFIRDRLAVLREEKAFDLDDLERGILLMNELPGMKIRAMLRPGASIGVNDLFLQVQDELPVSVTLDYDNFGPETVAEDRLGTTFEVGNLFDKGHVLTIRAVGGSDEGDVLYGQLTYMMPLPSGLKLTGSVSAYDYEAGGILTPLDPLGDGFSWSIKGAYPIVRHRTNTFDVEVGFEARDLEQELLGSPLIEDKLRVFTAGLFLDAPGSMSGRWIASLQVRRGLDGALGGTEEGDPFTSRPLADPDFTSVVFRGYRLHKLSNLFFAIIRVTAQFTNEPLYVAEQFSLGGGDNVRGYPPFEYLGDKGYLATVELRIKMPFLRGEKGYDWFQVALFYDRGKAELEGPAPGDLADETLDSYGIGLRFEVPDWGSIRLDYAKASGDPDPSDGDDSRIYVSAIFYLK